MLKLYANGDHYLGEFDKLEIGIDGQTFFIEADEYGRLHLVKDWSEMRIIESDSTSLLLA